jgi:hypothetical protein
MTTYMVKMSRVSCVFILQTHIQSKLHFTVFIVFYNVHCNGVQYEIQYSKPQTMVCQRAPVITTVLHNGTVQQKTQFRVASINRPGMKYNATVL